MAQTGHSRAANVLSASQHGVLANATRKSLDLQLKQLGLVVQALQVKHRMSDKELLARTKIAASTLQRIKEGRYHGKLGPFIRIGSVFDVAFICHFVSLSEALGMPKSYTEESNALTSVGPQEAS